MEFLTVGRIVNTHGIKGEVRVLPRTDFPETRFRPGSKLYIDLPGRPLDQWEVESSRTHKNMYLVRFKGIDDINEAEKFKGAWLRVPRSEKVDLEEDEYYFHEIIGCHVLTEDGESIGTVTEIWQPGANDVWVVKTADKRDVLIPAVSEVVLDVDRDKKEIVIRPLEGML
jgi:16S rRNA processing protein RimM